MTFHGIEYKHVIEGYRFEVAFDSGNETGLGQRDIWVAERHPVTELPLADFTGTQLLQAYIGADRGDRLARVAEQQREIRERREALQTAPRARSSKLVKQEKRELRALETALESTLARELRGLDRSLFDLEVLRDQVKRYGEARFLRTFYFDEVNERYILNFCRKYATDPAYREAVDNRRAPWVERNALFVRNLDRELWRERVIRMSSAAFDRAQREFFEWMCQHAAEIIALPEYERIKTLDDAFDPTARELDPGIRAGVAAWNEIDGAVTRFSCQGVSGTITYLDRTLLVASHHEEFAYITFERLDDLVCDAIEHCLPRFPAVRAVAHHRAGAWGPDAQLQFNALVSTGDNLAFRDEVVALAAEVKQVVERSS